MSLAEELNAFTEFVQNAVLLTSGFVFDLIFSPLSLTVLLVWLLLFLLFSQSTLS